MPLGSRIIGRDLAPISWALLGIDLDGVDPSIPERPRGVGRASRHGRWRPERVRDDQDRWRIVRAGPLAAPLIVRVS